MLAENVLCKLIKRTVPDNRCDCLVDRRQLRLLASNTSECTLANLPGDAVEPFGVVMWSHSHEEDVGFIRRVPISFVSGNRRQVPRGQWPVMEFGWRCHVDSKHS
jgi:hypothetical protein